jgi:hypothetical protein
MPRAEVGYCGSRKERLKAFKSRDKYRILILSVHET